MNVGRFRILSGCWFGQHENMLAREDGRLFLRCSECGRETPGWQVEDVLKRPAAEKKRLEAEAGFRPTVAPARP